ncbi:MAG: MazG family protein [Candidatus Nanopelagicales bacterium]
MTADGSAFLRLLQVMDRLRSPGGCPWDAEQTHASLVQYLIEETYETVDAVDSGDREALIEELGDVLLQVVFHARIGEESEQPWNLDDVARGITDKLIRRHPHVFGDAIVDSAAATEVNWQRIKNVEKQRASVVDGVPVSMPPLVQAAALMRRAGHGGVDHTLASAEARAAAEELLAKSDGDVGMALLSLIELAHERGTDADAQARAAVRQLRGTLESR